MIYNNNNQRWFLEPLLSTKLNKNQISFIIAKLLIYNFSCTSANNKSPNKMLSDSFNRFDPVLVIMIARGYVSLIWMTGSFCIKKRVCLCVCVDRWLTACGLLSGGEGLTQGKGKWETEPHDKRPDLPLWVCSENSQTIKAPWVCLIVSHTHTHTIRPNGHISLSVFCACGMTSLWLTI